MTNAQGWRSDGPGSRTGSKPAKPWKSSNLNPTNAGRLKAQPHYLGTDDTSSDITTDNSFGRDDLMVGRDTCSAGSTPTSTSKLKLDRIKPLGKRSPRGQKFVRAKSGQLPKVLKQFYNKYVGEKGDPSLPVDKLLLLHEVAAAALKVHYHPEPANTQQTARAASANIPMVHCDERPKCPTSALHHTDHPPISLQRSPSDTDPCSLIPVKGRKGRMELIGPCDHCNTTISPQWRKGPPDKAVLCNACGTRWLRNKTLDGKHSGRVGKGKGADGGMRGEDQHESEDHREEGTDEDMGVYSTRRGGPEGEASDLEAEAKEVARVPTTSIVGALQKAMERSCSSTTPMLTKAVEAEPMKAKKLQRRKPLDQQEVRKKVISSANTKKPDPAEVPTNPVVPPAYDNGFILSMLQQGAQATASGAPSAAAVPSQIQALLMHHASAMPIGPSGHVLPFPISSGQPGSQTFIEAAQHQLRWMMANAPSQAPGSLPTNFPWNN